MPKTNLVTRIDPDLKEAFKEFCKSKTPPVKMSAYVEYLIKKEMREHTRSAPLSYKTTYIDADGVEHEAPDAKNWTPRRLD